MKTKDIAARYGFDSLSTQCMRWGALFLPYVFLAEIHPPAGGFNPPSPDSILSNRQLTAYKGELCGRSESGQTDTGSAEGPRSHAGGVFTDG